MMIVRIYSATDECGNVALCRQKISFFNVPMPSVQIAPSVLLEGVTAPNGTMSNAIYDILPLNQPFSES